MPRFAKTRGIVLRKYEFSESSHVLTVLTRDYGRVQMLAKGSRRMGRKRVEGFLDLLSLVDLVMIPKPSGALSTLTEFEIRNEFREVRTDLPRLASALFIAEIAALGSEEFQRNDAVFDLVRQVLEELETAPAASLPALMLGFDVRFLRRIGFGLELESCAVSRTPRARCRRTWFSPAAGGLVDAEHRFGDPRAVEASPGVFAILAALGRGSWDAARRTRVTRASYREARRLLVGYYQYVFERRLRSLQFLESTLFA